MTNQTQELTICTAARVALLLSFPSKFLCDMFTKYFSVGNLTAQEKAMISTTTKCIKNNQFNSYFYGSLKLQ